jgi:hypothetical protein
VNTTDVVVDTLRIGDKVDDVINVVNATSTVVTLVDRLAFGLSQHPAHGYDGLLARFADHVGAQTYWDVYEDIPDAQIMAERLVGLMNDANSIHFNLDGMLTNGDTISDLLVKGAMGAGEGNWTNWEFYVIATNAPFLEKTVFYLNGIPTGIAP